MQTFDKSDKTLLKLTSSFLFFISPLNPAQVRKKFSEMKFLSIFLKTLFARRLLEQLEQDSIEMNLKEWLIFNHL